MLDKPREQAGRLSAHRSFECPASSLNWSRRETCQPVCGRLSFHPPPCDYPRFVTSGLAFPSATIRWLASLGDEILLFATAGDFSYLWSPISTYPVDFDRGYCSALPLTCQISTTTWTRRASEGRLLMPHRFPSKSCPAWGLTSALPTCRLRRWTTTLHRSTIRPHQTQHSIASRRLRLADFLAPRKPDNHQQTSSAPMPTSPSRGTRPLTRPP